MAGGVIVIPAGVAHQNVGSSGDFGVVGAYPDGRDWDLLRGQPGERPQADKNNDVSCGPSFGHDDPVFATEI